MTVLDRRALLRLLLSACGALPLLSGGLGCAPGSRPAASDAPVPEVAPRFLHGVASGDPLADRVVLWTRVSGLSNAETEVHWIVARDPDLREPIREGTSPATSDRDFTVKVDVAELPPGETLYYRFEVGDVRSPVGRTRTLPDGRTDRLRFAVASCSNLAFGFFNAYALMAQRNDLDAVLHLGDYLYEYRNGEYGDGSALDRVPEPDAEIVTLEDYRLRHAQYKRDPDLQEAHRQHPFLVVWDDHEITNNAFRTGAENHDPDRGEGSFEARRAAAVRAYLEWMPVRESDAFATGCCQRSFVFGDLATLIMLDTRLCGRDEQVSASDATALARGERSLLGSAQEAWLRDELDAAKAQGTLWNLLGQQVVVSPLRARDGRIRNPDAWDGYPFTRRRLLDHVRSAGIDNVVVLTGDVHSSWAIDVAEDPFSPAIYDPATGRGAVAVEFVTPAVTSPAVRDPVEAEQRAADVRARHPHVRFVELHRQGYLVLDVDRERVQADWFFVDTVTERRATERHAQALATRAGRSHAESVPGPAAPRSDRPTLAP